MQALRLDKGALLRERGRRFAVIAIGRNEGDRLKRCLESVSRAIKVLYVDSGSTDGSLQWARERGVDVVELDMSIPFTAARARNAGFWRLREVAPDISYVQFVDGDCELNGEWPKQAIDFLETHGEFAAVCGRRRELYPEKSIYNWLCDVEWNGSWQRHAW
jgi:glycosyltransferase involved in cell wall biosynthesis